MSLAKGSRVRWEFRHGRLSPDFRRGPPAHAASVLRPSASGGLVPRPKGSGHRVAGLRHDGAEINREPGKTNP
jgi:hypothetical protein